MFSGISMFTGVNLPDDENQDVCVINQKWLSPDGTYASIPNMDSTKFHRLVRNHAVLPDDTPLRPVSILIHTGKKNLKNLSSEDDTPPKRFGENTPPRTVGSPFTGATWVKRPQNIRSFRNQRGVSQYSIHFPKKLFSKTSKYTELL
ncbi:hypothetical protein FGIG_04988 [Fasciola gigantica]|uniref:Uncharacterized protein n=1 Tax=Fasciola gigantica TaxID=46835 RepID=A0A504YWB2_FASGI|nr:hypothetical protein FGIG_04988 [Fasciola gigantica]